MKYKITCLLIGLMCMSGCGPILTEKTVVIQSNGQQQTINEQSEKEEIQDSYTEEPNLDSLLKPTLIVTIGDSLTQGVGDSTDHGGYLPYLQKQLDSDSNLNSVKMVNHGVKGNRSVQLLKQLSKEKVRKDIEYADSIVVNIGGNDIMQVFKQNFTNLDMEQFRSAQREYEATLNQIFDKIRTYNKSASIYFIGLYNPFSKNMDELYEIDLIISDWNKSGEKIVEKYHSAYYIKIEDIFKNPTEDVMYTDYFHPNDRGYELIATRIFRNMEFYINEEKTIEAGAKGDGK